MNIEMANSDFLSAIAADIVGANRSIDILVDLDPISRRAGWISDALGYLTALADARLELKCLIHWPKDIQSRQRVRADVFEDEISEKGWKARSVDVAPTLDVIIIDSKKCIIVHDEGLTTILSREVHFDTTNSIIDHFNKAWQSSDTDNILNSTKLIYEDLIALSVPCISSSILQNSKEFWDEIFKQIIIHPKRLYDLDSRRFEELIAELLSREGFSVQLTQRSRDGGKDIIAENINALGNHLYLVECKRWAPDNPVGVRIVRSFFGVIEHERATAGMIATTSRFTKDALSFVEPISYRMSLKEYANLVDWIKSKQ